MNTKPKFSLPIKKSSIATQSLPWGKWGLRVTAASYLTLMVLLPISAIFKKGLEDGFLVFWAEITNPIAFSALKLTLIMAMLTTVINILIGTLTAYVLVRYRFPGLQLLNWIIDLPFAIPTLVTGLMLVILYGPQQILGSWLEAHNIRIIFATPGIMLALLFVTYPFVIRTVQAVLIEVEKKQEEAAYTMGASK
ncbi:MAG: sulfate ABC transporter permease protein CysT, partial [bacterium]